MSKTRQQKVARLIQKELGMIFQEQAKTLFSGKMITVTAVRMTPDLGLAKVYLSIFPLKAGEDFLTVIKEHVKMIRHELGNRIRFQLRIIPELMFYIDDSLDYYEKIEKLLHK
jgi:ribosome-binding factor A